MTSRAHDLVHSFCYAVRSGQHEFPFILQSHRVPSIGNFNRDLQPAWLEPFASYAFLHGRDSVLALNSVVAFSSFARLLSPAERAETISILQRFYNVPRQRTCETIRAKLL